MRDAFEALLRQPGDRERVLTRQGEQDVELGRLRSQREPHGAGR